MDILISVLQLFVITDPLGNLPIFHMLTKGETLEARRKTYLSATVFAVTILLFFALVGTYILRLFNITMADLKIAGGLLLLILAIMIIVRGNWIEVKDNERTIGAVPLACPLLAGPGAISTAMVLLGTYGYQVTLASILINFVISFVILYQGEAIFRILGENGSEIIARVMAIFLASIAVHFVLSGVSEIFLLTIH